MLEAAIQDVLISKCMHSGKGRALHITQTS